MYALIEQTLTFCFYQQLYMDAVDSYGQQNYDSTMEKMEKALSEYYTEYERCTLSCEGSYDHASLPELYNAIAGWRAYLYLIFQHVQIRVVLVCTPTHDTC